MNGFLVTVQGAPYLTPKLAAIGFSPLLSVIKKKMITFSKNTMQN